MEDPTPLGQYLGCNHVQGTVTLPNGNTANTVTYDMEEFLGSCVVRYQDLAKEITGEAPKLLTVATPFIEDSPGGCPAGSPCAPEGTPSVFCLWCNHHFPIAGNQSDQITALRKKERDRAKAQKGPVSPPAPTTGKVAQNGTESSDCAAIGGRPGSADSKRDTPGLAGCPELLGNNANLSVSREQDHPKKGSTTASSDCAASGWEPGPRVSKASQVVAAASDCETDYCSGTSDTEADSDWLAARPAVPQANEADYEEVMIIESVCDNSL